MARLLYINPGPIGTIGGHEITINPGVEALATSRYRELAEAITSVDTAPVRVDACAYMLLDTPWPDFQVQITHPDEIADLTCADSREWVIVTGNHGIGDTTEEVHPAETPVAVIAARADELVMMGPQQQCRAFLMCTQQATTTIDAGPLGIVASCERCAAILKRRQH
jgi:hypothetical protein